MASRAPGREEIEDRTAPPDDDARAVLHGLVEGADTVELLTRIAGRVRVLAGGHAARIEQRDGLDEACVLAADESAGDHADTERITFALGGRADPSGVLVLMRSRSAPPVPADALGHIRVYVDLATLVLRELRMRDELRRTSGDYQRAVEQKFRLIRGIGEDLRNRMGVAEQYIALLDTDGQQGEQERHWIERSRHSIELALHLMSELVGLARAETGRIALEIEPIDIASVVRAMVHDYDRAASAGPAFRVTFEPMPRVETDLESVRRILDNLLGNAVRYTPGTGVIRVAAEVRPGRRRADPTKWICISVSDDGPGIEDADRVFEEVDRVERHGPRPGFRLAISRRIARLLGGDLTVESQPGVGSTFILWLPDRPTLA